MSTVTLITAATLVALYNASIETLTTVSAPVTENERIEALSTDPEGKQRRIAHIQQKIKGFSIPNCFSDARYRQHRGHKRVQSEASAIVQEKPRYVHTPQHAASSFMRTTTPVPFGLRPLAEDVVIEPVQTPAQKAEELRQIAREKVAEGSRPIIVGSSGPQ